MSGRGKRALYYTVTAAGLVLALAACMFMFYSVYRESENLLYPLTAFLAFCGVMTISPCALVHECGHLVFAALAGMKPVCVRFGLVEYSVAEKRIRFGFSSVSGKTEFLPKEPCNLRARVMAVSLGGACLNFLFAVLSGVLFFVLPAHPVLLFFALFAPLHLIEGLAAVLPAELNTGRTDGELFRILHKKKAEGEVYLNVLTVQSVILTSTFDGVEEKLLFGTPVVREDDAAFLALLHLRWQYLMWKGETEKAAKELFRLEELSGYLDGRARAQVKCDAVFMRRVLGQEEETRLSELGAAEGTPSYCRAALALGQGDPDEYKKIAAQEFATGVRALELKFIEQFIQNF